MPEPANRQDRPVMIVSNRGPVAFSLTETGLSATRGAGGLVSGLGPLAAEPRTTWLAAAISDGDRRAATRGTVEAEGLRVRLLATDPERYRLAYDQVCNATLWFVHHRLFDLARTPRWDRELWDAWDAYREVNEAFAAEVAEAAEPDAVVLIQDYHLTLLAPHLRSRRPDLTLVHFSHTPFGEPTDLAVLPPTARRELLAGMAAHHACGFHAHRWADAFTASLEANDQAVPRVFVSPLAPDAEDIAGVAASSAGEEAARAVAKQVGDRHLVLRVDRIELSKNLLRGFDAFDELLATHPEWRGRVVLGAFVYPSRQGLTAYAAYRAEVEAAVADLRSRWATADWDPVLYDDGDEFTRSVAALRRYDVLLVNPIRDGLNLVAKEGPLVNERDGTLVLSTEAGVWDELGDAAIGVVPFDVSGTASALRRALSTPAGERAETAQRLRAIAGARSPGDWLADQLTAAG